MFALITGGVKNGKSKFGEALCIKQAGRMCYIATMFRNPADEEVKRKIEKHRLLRKDKGFTTVEAYTGLKNLNMAPFDTVLLECIPNLLANEMFMIPNCMESAVDEILLGIRKIRLNSEHLVVITNEVSLDGVRYDGETTRYIENIGYINRVLAAEADNVYEVVCGIPLCLKSGAEEGARA